MQLFIPHISEIALTAAYSFTHLQYMLTFLSVLGIVRKQEIGLSVLLYNITVRGRK